MKKLIALTLITLVVFALSNIDLKSGKMFSIAEADTTDLNPNGSSELALLMREMTAHAEQVRIDVMNNKLPQPYPASFNKLKTATPTNGEMKNEHYNAFADLYLSAVKVFSNSTKETLVDNYNNLISSCIACHTTHCPGPMVRIKKMPVEIK